MPELITRIPKRLHIMRNIVHTSWAKYRDVPQQVFYVSPLGKPGFLRSSARKESTCNAGGSRFDSWVRKIPWGRDRLPSPVFMGFPGGSDGKESTCNSGDLGSMPGLGRSPGEGHGNALQYSCLRNPMDRGAWRATVHGLTESRTRLSD